MKTNRHILHKYKNLLINWRGVIRCFGKHKITNDPTVLIKPLVELTFDNIELDHAWCITNEQFNKLFFKKNDIIEFEAIVKQYSKKLKNKKYEYIINDYGLYQPKLLKIIGSCSNISNISCEKIKVLNIMNECSNIPKN